ncbi:hypothetical protein POTOM_061163 [Populus tomentosa]|uniref:DNA-directed RNA polymerase N-terminal domain-containing protein n=1 Tax=Populus tomentosa TaxID=118781 RepID=A0A8X7XMC7_POPTO|nr:hypothetical protein POTOM_061163 [Populus tomentosa]
MDNTGKEKIEAIFLDMPEIKESQWNMEAFSKMSKLRLLKINNVQLSEGPEDLSNKLRFLECHSYPSKSLPVGLQVDQLVELHMANISFEQLWYGYKSAVNLKIINLSNSLNLIKTPDFTGIPNLESLILEGCTSLSEVHPSLAHHKKLQYVSLMDCKSIRILPNNLEMGSLKVCILDGCSKLEKFPDIVGNMNCLMVLRLDGTENLGKVESLEEFDGSGTSIRQPPASIFLLKNLKVLSFDGCKRIAVNPTDHRLPSLLGLCSLEVLDLCACNLKEGALPEDIGCLSSLKSLDLSQNNFISLPESINQLSGLEMLVLEDCRMLESLPEGLSNPRPGFGIIVPGNKIPGWFNHQSKGSSISVQVPSWSMGFVAYVAFSANGESPSLSCHFKSNGRENYRSPISISCNSIQVLSDHVWLFYLSFDYLKELKEWKHESFSNIELSFHSDERRVKVKNCGVCLLSSLYSTSAHFIVTSFETASSYKASLAFSSSYHHWMASVFPGIRAANTSAPAAAEGAPEAAAGARAAAATGAPATAAAAAAAEGAGASAAAAAAAGAGAAAAAGAGAGAAAAAGAGAAAAAGAWELATKEYKELLKDMCEHKLAPNLPYMKSLFLADKMSVIAMHQLAAMVMTGGEHGCARVVTAACMIGDAIEQEIRIHNILEKTRRKKEKANDSKNGVEGESLAVMKEQENLRKKVTDLIKKQKLPAVRKIVKGKDDSKPWNADARAKFLLFSPSSSAVHGSREDTKCRTESVTVSVMKQIRIHNILEKTRRKRKRLICEAAWKGKADSKPWNAMARIRLEAVLIELLLQTAYITASL